MKFAHTDPPATVDLEIPDRNLVISDTGGPFRVFVGLPSWSRQQIEGFYPKGVGSELAYYSKHFNSVELNETFDRVFPPSQFEKWREETPEGFLFFPKLPKEIADTGRVRGFDRLVEQFFAGISKLLEKFGAVLMQTQDDFGPYNFDRLRSFISEWDQDVPLYIELRHPGWYSDSGVTEKMCNLLKANKVGHVITDTAGRRDMMHMRLTTPFAYVRFVGSGAPEIDEKRLDAWAHRIAEWKSEGLTGGFFLILEHENRRLIDLSGSFIEKLNQQTGTRLKVPPLRPGSD